MQSNGGLMRSEDIEEAPVNTLLSGPVGGVVGSVKLAHQLGLTNIITIDMGGTSTDISLIQDGNVELITEAEIAYQPVKVPQVNIHTIGAGGGSIISLFGNGLKVGPQSAGANPGPVCYGKGGLHPTTTDAALQLGYIDPDYFLGGTMRLDYERSRQVLSDSVGKPLGLSVEEASYAALLIQSVNIEGGIRAVSLEKGYDPREFILLSFGGASGLFVGRVAQQLSIPRVLVPRETAVFSALGLLMADIRRTRSLTRVIPVNQTRSGEVKTIFDRLEEEIEESLKAEGGSSHEMELERSCDMRYVGQAYEINVPFPEISRAITDQTLGELCRQFHLDHRKRFGHSAEEEPVEIVCSRVLGILPVRKREFTRTEATGKDPLKGYRKAYFGKERESIRCPIYERKHMVQGHLFKGPAIVEDPVTTIVIYPDQSVELDPMGNLILYTSHKA
jgi:N-methylhydantoinase A